MLRLTVLLACALLGSLVVRAADSTAPPVTVQQDDRSFTLDNGIVQARVDKKTGDLIALRFRGLDLLRPGKGYWSFSGSEPKLGPVTTTTVRQDPSVNGGARAEVSCLHTHNDAADTLPVDLEMRYSLGRGEPGVYVSSVWRHAAGTPAFSVGEARYALKLAPAVFDYLAIDEARHRVMPSGADWDAGTPLNLKEARRLTTGIYAGQAEHKYDYSATLSQTPAYGWASTARQVGLWIVQPSMEYLAGGPTKVELTGHLDVNKGGAPVLLNMWCGSHYGGSSFVVSTNEAWSKMVGPFFLYLNWEQAPEALWRDALARAGAEAKAWPYAWVNDAVNYPAATVRARVTGKIDIQDPLAPSGWTWKNLQVGLSAPDETAPRRGGTETVSWQRDAKHYQFWTQADASNYFTLDQVRPGRYTLHAFADGILGEFAKANIELQSGQSLDLGELHWTPERHGRQLWDIGIPNRSASEFRHGDDFWHWGLYLKYPQEFPHDVQYTIGSSDYRRDWNYCQPPRLDANSRVTGPSTWTIHFDLPQPPRGVATLRLAFCGSRAGGEVSVTLNGAPIGSTGPLPESGVMHRDGIQGFWFEKQIAIPAGKLQAGHNNIQLTSAAKQWHQAVLYDYVRLEAED